MNSDDSYNNEQGLNKEQINAYVDDQLSTEVKAEILKKSQDDETLAEEICQAQVLKGMIKLAYQTPPDKALEQKKRTSSQPYWRTGIAASLFLIIGVLSGWYSAFQYGGLSTGASTFQQVKLTPGLTNEHQVLLHISTDEPARVEAALNNAERLLTANDNDEHFQLQILVNSKGILILQKNESPFIERLKALTGKSENVALLACQRSIERQQLKGVEVHLVKEAKVIPEALSAIVSRLHQGWVYIRA